MNRVVVAPVALPGLEEKARFPRVVAKELSSEDRKVFFLNRELIRQPWRIIYKVEEEESGFLR